MGKKKNKKTEPVPKKKNNRSGFGKRFSIAFLTGIVLLLAVGLGVTFIPEEKVPQNLAKVYDELLTVRNTVIARSGLRISRYDDSVNVTIDGSPSVQLYFAPSPKIDKGLCDLIDSASSTVDICIYDLDLDNVTDALIRAKERGVQVRAVTDSDNYSLESIDRLVHAGITVHQDKRPAIMHNKFVIVDAKKIWTGSYNFTVHGTFKNDNNALILRSPTVAACYREKFEEYLDGKYGPDAKLKTQKGRIILGDLPVQVAFAPADKVSTLILDRLHYAKKSVRVMAFAFTSKPIAEELAYLARKGVRVECLLDRGQAKSKFSRSKYLRGLGIYVKIAPNRRGKMHHKVIIIDDETVITGSYNFSSNAENSNDENIMILQNKKIAEQYNREFKRCWKGTKGY